ncbi:sigma E protease regulator RseP [Enterovibrio nigricans]|uniref:Zinc metalloprotease n=1 Tax=Enterovibrio nigricans DSM 22720 TaxID=1121868 RepID=A0A1T4UC32_9GAMM|nr:sigma E protease regulator RseP [Enterovibrio nigricans]PKF51468.1 sigma E protease regulator RseP [Enterovibrio nigricans]SKA50140.1 regulator of sigma E protease [Enterovibrio nigricans DSM 22720]
MSGILWNLLFFLVALGILIAVHEFGHFWVARRCGVKVERFSIGFGKAIWQKVGKDGTEYTLAMIPLGGYVKMLDGRVDDIPSGQEAMAFNNRPLWQRSAIVAAGPIANFLFAIFAYWIVMVMGVPAVKPVVGDVAQHSIAANAGIEPGMELTAVSGIKTRDWESVNLQLISHIGDEEMTLSVKPDDNAAYSVDKPLDLTSWSYDPESQSALRTLGITPFTPAISTTIAQVMENSAAERAGLKTGDELLSIDREPVTDWTSVVEAVRANPGKSITLGVERSGESVDVNLVPDIREQGELNIGYAGFSPEIAAWPESYRFTLQYGPLDAIPAAMDKTWQVVVLTAEMIKKLFTGDVAVKNLSGPISIAKGAGMTADFGLVYFLGFLALISVNLGIINLLPLPVLDGGHLLFFGIEAVTRRPVSEKVQDIGYRVGSAIIVVLMVVAIFNDVARL